jgi:hypothetical protein
LNEKATQQSYSSPIKNLLFKTKKERNSRVNHCNKELAFKTRKKEKHQIVMPKKMPKNQTV